MLISTWWGGVLPALVAGGGVGRFFSFKTRTIAHTRGLGAVSPHSTHRLRSVCSPLNHAF